MDGLTYVSTVPKIWLGGNDECKWPKDKGREKQAIIKELLPESDWYTLKKVKVLGEYCTYKEALYYEKKKENGCSSSNSDVEKGKGKRKKKINQKYVDRDNYSITPPPQLICESENESNESVSSDEGNETIVPMVVNPKYIEHDVPVTGIVTTSDPSPSSLIEQAEVIFESNYRQDNNDKILNMLVNMQATLEILKAKIFTIDEKLGAIAITEEINKDLLPKMPVNSVEEIQELEKSLEIPECKKALFQYLKCSGGISERNCIFRNLEKVFTDFVAQFCSWTGQKQNFKLSNLKIMEIVKSAIRVSYPGMTDENYEKAVMQWFQHGKTRYLRRGPLREQN